ncbi:MAG: methyltransferase domain-containing protein [Acidobacteria bacterium]|nr:methyltransferase domain-containing protein [Acidobacteriota bacterium]MCA1652090.1 methyltransferase domain-containing protein [Acidobacteriota bacterium]
MSDWDATLYHRLSEPQRMWGVRVLQRLAPERGERILDLGCGTGRLTSDLVTAAGDGQIVALDRSETMLAEAARWFADRGMRAALVRGDGAALPFVEAFRAVFSTATLHWIRDHATAFAGIYRVLEPGGRFIAQCGGGPNLRGLLTRAHALMASPAFRASFQQWDDPWEFADVATTTERLARAGFIDIDVSLEPAPTSLATADAYCEFIACVCVRHHVDRLPPGDRPAFVNALAAAAAGDDPPFTLDYWRLNIEARKPEGAAART